MPRTSVQDGRIHTYTVRNLSLDRLRLEIDVRLFITYISLPIRISKLYVACV
jgi:hypothetical protein